MRYASPHDRPFTLTWLPANKLCITVSAKHIENIPCYEAYDFERISRVGRSVVCQNWHEGKQQPDHAVLQDESSDCNLPVLCIGCLGICQTLHDDGCRRHWYLHLPLTLHHMFDLFYILHWRYEPIPSVDCSPLLIPAWAYCSLPPCGGNA